MYVYESGDSTSGVSQLTKNTETQITATSRGGSRFLSRKVKSALRCLFAAVNIASFHNPVCQLVASNADHIYCVKLFYIFCYVNSSQSLLETTVVGLVVG